MIRDIKVEILLKKQKELYHWVISERESDEDIDQIYILSQNGYHVKSRAYHAGLSWARAFGFTNIEF